MSSLDLIVFLGFILGVVALGLWQSRGGNNDESAGTKSYFLAGRGLSWWLVGLSLIAANIFTEQLVGMSGQAADWLGHAMASYDWMAAVTFVPSWPCLHCAPERATRPARHHRFRPHPAAQRKNHRTNSLRPNLPALSLFGNTEP